MRIRELLIRPAEAYVLTTVEALTREPDGRYWIDQEAECYLPGEAPPSATIKVRLGPSPGGTGRYEASIHQGQSGIPVVGAQPSGSVAVTPEEFD